jgi:glycerol-3-phosphate cytidylyltransferase-like family protein
MTHVLVSGCYDILHAGHKAAIIASLSMVDRVVMGEGPKHGLDFEEHFLRLRPDILAVTEDDQYAENTESAISRSKPPALASSSHEEIELLVGRNSQFEARSWRKKIGPVAAGGRRLPAPLRSPLAEFATDY